MGLTEISIIVHGPKGSKKVRLIVDTGSTYTWIDGNLLKEMGISPIGVGKFKTIDKRIIERYIADVLIEYDGSNRYCPVAFAEEGDANVLGVTAMEIIGLEVDPITHEVRHIAAYISYAVS